MYEHDIEMTDSEPLQTVLNGAAHAVGRVVEYDRCLGDGEKGKFDLPLFCLEALSSLPTFDERMYSSDSCCASSTRSVSRRARARTRATVVVAHAGAPGRIQGLIRILVGDDFELVAQRYTAQTELDGWYVVPVRSPAPLCVPLSGAARPGLPAITPRPPGRSPLPRW